MIHPAYLGIHGEQLPGEGAARKRVVQPYEPGLFRLPWVPVRHHEDTRDARVPSYEISWLAAEEAVLHP